MIVLFYQNLSKTFYNFSIRLINTKKLEVMEYTLTKSEYLWSQGELIYNFKAMWSHGKQ